MTAGNASALPEGVEPLIPALTLGAETDEMSEMPSKVYTQKYILQKATKNGARIKAVDAEQNSLHYINLRDHDMPYIYISAKLIESLSNGGKLPVAFDVEMRAVEWEE